ncbi:NAD-dependent epimerase/dehydratase family protein [bacterium]|nr:NAD-dependent epimerase/dehydratase family protein [bacterium]
MKIFMTGATGFLGNELLKKLQSSGHSVTALVRNPQKARLTGDVQILTGEMESPVTYSSAFKDHDVFLHIAALVKMWAKDRSQFDRVNIEATETAIKAASDAGISKIVYSSSFIALGPSNGKPLTEEDTRRNSKLHNDYERTKYLADQKARKLQLAGYPLYILYPGVIYGPGNLTYGNIVAKNLIPFLNGRMPFGLPLHSWNYVFVKDVVNGFMKVIEGTPPSNRYILGGENHDGKSFYETVYEVTGKKPPAINMPFGLAKAAGYSEYLLAKLFGREPSLLTHEVVEIYKLSWAYDSSRAIRELGYTITSLRDGLIELVGWLKNSGYVK